MGCACAACHAPIVGDFLDKINPSSDIEDDTLNYVSDVKEKEFKAELSGTSHGKIGWDASRVV